MFILNKKRFLKIFLTSALAFSLLFMIFGEDIFLKSEVEDEDSIEDLIKGDNTKNIMFLVLGVDSPDYSSSEPNRTDTMILAGMDFENDQLSMLSIPRDTRVLKSNGYHDKINHAHAYGGVPLTLEAVNKFLDLDLEHYVKLDYKAVKEIVDAIGGVDIYVPFDMVYADPTPGKEFFIDLKEGQQTLNGDEALQFLRWRKNNDGSGYPEGDLGRIKAQQEFMKELIKQSMSAKNILKVNKFISIYNNYLDTNIPLNTVLKGAWTAKDLDFSTIKMDTLKGESAYINNISYYIYDESGIYEQLDELFPYRR